jgi:hypothetical protein
VSSTIFPIVDEAAVPVNDYITSFRWPSLGQNSPRTFVRHPNADETNLIASPASATTDLSISIGIPDSDSGVEIIEPCSKTSSDVVVKNELDDSPQIIVQAKESSKPTPRIGSQLAVGSDFMLAEKEDNRLKMAELAFQVASAQVLSTEAKRNANQWLASFFNNHDWEQSL